MLRGCILFPPGMGDASSDDAVHQISNGWWMSLIHRSWAPIPTLQIKGDHAIITRLVSKWKSNTKSLRLTAKTPFFSSRHLHWHFPDHSWPSSPLSELPAHTTIAQNVETQGVTNTSGGVDPLASFGTADFVPQCRQLIPAWSNIAFMSSQNLQAHHDEHICPTLAFWLPAALLY